ncbi:MAG: hypothetical protein ACRC1M_06030 [Methanobacteriaceae archaeon]
MSIKDDLKRFGIYDGENIKPGIISSGFRELRVDINPLKFTYTELDDDQLIATVTMDNANSWAKGYISAILDIIK